jgi:hypothetical protein
VRGRLTRQAWRWGEARLLHGLLTLLLRQLLDHVFGKEVQQVAAFVHPKPMTFMWYPGSACASEDRVTTLYFSRMFPSRRKFSATTD